MANPAPKPNDYGPESVPRAATWRRSPQYLEDLNGYELERLYERLAGRDLLASLGSDVADALLATVYREICRRPAAVR